MSAYLNVAVREHEGAIVLYLDGELDLGSAWELEEAINVAWQGRPSRVVIDLKDLGFIDMAGLRVLISARQQAERKGQKLVLANLPEPVRRVVGLAQVSDLLPELE